MVVGDKKKNTLLAIKRVTLLRKTRAKLEFAAPDEVGFAYIVGFSCVYTRTRPYGATRFSSGRNAGSSGDIFTLLFDNLDVLSVSWAVSRVMFKATRHCTCGLIQGTTTAVLPGGFHALRGWW